MQDFSENFNSFFGNTIKWKPKQILRDSGSIGKVREKTKGWLLHSERVVCVH